MASLAAIAVVREADLSDLLPLMRAYCDFYEVTPSDAALLAMSRALIADPQREGTQLIARNAGEMPGQRLAGVFELLVAGDFRQMARDFVHAIVADKRPHPFH